MAVDDLAVVTRFVVEVLEQGDLAALDELVDTSSAAVNWDELKNFLGTIKDEAPGLTYHVGDLEDHSGGVRATLRLAIPIGFHLSNGRINAIELPDYLLPDMDLQPEPQAAPPEKHRDVEMRVQELRRDIDSLAAELAAGIERLERTRRDVSEARERQAFYEDRAARARELGNSGEADRALSRARTAEKLAEAYEQQRVQLREVIERLASSLQKNEERLLRIELQAEELPIRNRLAEVIEHLDGITERTTDHTRRIAAIENQVRAAEDAAREDLKRVHEYHKRRLESLRNLRDSRDHLSADLEERLKEIQDEVGAKPQGDSKTMLD